MFERLINKTVEETIDKELPSILDKAVARQIKKMMPDIVADYMPKFLAANPNAELTKEAFDFAFYIALKERWTGVDRIEAREYIGPYVSDYGKPGFTFTYNSARDAAKEVADEFSEES